MPLLGHKILRETLKSFPPRRFLILFLAPIDLLVVSQNSLVVSIVGFAFALIVSELAVYVLHVTFVVAEQTYIKTL